MNPAQSTPGEQSTTESVRQALLAVDLGLRTGLARFGSDGRLLHYESRNFGTMARLKRAAPIILRETADLAFVMLEGGGSIAEVWRHECERRCIPHRIVSAETWRQDLLYPRRQRTGVIAKRTAGELARRVIEWSGAKAAKTLRDDAAEAILLGLWAARELGWLREIPAKLLGGKG